jgi:hypothetical protein
VSSLLDAFQNNNKDYIFLVNEDLKSSRNDADPIEEKLKNTLTLIFKEHIKSEDRISLMTYGKNTKKLFNLVNTHKNMT